MNAITFNNVLRKYLASCLASERFVYSIPELSKCFWLLKCSKYDRINHKHKQRRIVKDSH